MRRCGAILAAAGPPEREELGACGRLATNLISLGIFIEGLRLTFAGGTESSSAFTPRERRYSISSTVTFQALKRASAVALAAIVTSRSKK
jgi:hypothetical protein